MSRTTSLFVVFLIAIPCRAQVIDKAGFFKKATIEEADKQIAQIKERTGKQVVVLTLEKAPEKYTKDINTEDARQRRETFATMARDEMGKNYHGLHVIVCSNPKHIEITVSDDADDEFGKKYRDHLKARLIGSMQPDNPDQNFLRRVRNSVRTSPDADRGLLDSLRYVELRFEWNRAVDNTNFHFCLGIMGGLLVLWMFLGILRSRLRRSTPDSEGVHNADDSGRSIAVLGGGIGAVSGDWLVRVLFHPEPAEAKTSPVPQDVEPGEH